ERRRAAAQALQAGLQQFTLAAGLVDVLDDTCLEIGVMLQTLGLGGEHLLGLLLHGVSITQPIQQVVGCSGHWEVSCGSEDRPPRLLQEEDRGQWSWTRFEKGRPRLRWPLLVLSRSRLRRFRLFAAPRDERHDASGNR